MRRLAGSSAVTSRPSMKIFPSPTCSSPAISLSNVDFPQPDGPSSTTNLPFSARKLTASTACTAPKRFDTLSRTISDTRLPRGGTDQPCDAKYCIRILRDGRRAAWSGHALSRAHEASLQPLRARAWRARLGEPAGSVQALRGSAAHAAADPEGRGGAALTSVRQLVCAGRSGEGADVSARALAPARVGAGP